MGLQSLRGLASVLTWDCEAKNPRNGSGRSGIPEGNNVSTIQTKFGRCMRTDHLWWLPSRRGAVRSFPFGKVTHTSPDEVGMGG